jgi:hypothetical protein
MFREDKPAYAFLQITAAIARRAKIRSDWYRAQAVRCAAQASITPDGIAKTMIADAAAAWLKIAAVVEKYETK